MNRAQRQWLWLVIGTIGFAGSLITAQALLSSRSWRLDFTPARRYVLSDYSRRFLDGLDKPVSITAFLRSDDPRNADIEDLLRRMSIASPRIRTRSIDVNRNPGVAREFGVDSYGSVVVESDGRRRDFSNPNEELVIAAIAQVTRPVQHRVYFVTGHGERQFANDDKRQGYGSARSALLTERYEIAELNLLSGQIPPDADVLVIAGPRKDFLTAELLAIDAYLQGGGALLALLDPSPLPGLASLIKRFGIVLADEVVLDSENRLSAGDYLTMLVPERSKSHPVSARQQVPPLMSRVRPVRVEEPSPPASALILLSTGTSSWSTSDLTKLQIGSGEIVAGRDTPGPIPVVASALSRPTEANSARLIVVGDADFASDAFLGYLGNRDLLLNSVNWLAGEEAMIGTRPPSKVPGEQQFFVSAAQGRMAFVLTTIVMPMLVLFAGFAVFAYRRMNG